MANTKAYATLVTENILAIFCVISILLLINVISVNAIKVLIFGNRQDNKKP